MENNIIYETLTNIVERIKLAPENTTIEQMNDLNEVADRFKLSLYEMVIVAFIAVEDKEFNTEEIIDLIQSKIGIKSLLIKRLIRKLGKRNIIERERFSDKMSIALNETYLSAIESGDWKVVEELVPYGLYPFLRSIRHLIGGGFSYGHRMAMHFDECQIYRIDHYLGKETVQNLMAVRFGNMLFEPLWNSQYIDHIQVTVAETVGVAGRGEYYDRSGAMRDMVQNHLLQVLSLIAMEPPASLDADSIRDEKLKVLKALRPINLQNVQEKTVRGQYAAGFVAGKSVPGYLDEEDARPNSKTETFVAIKVDIDNWRWAGVPFYLRTGKRMPNKVSEVVICFKPQPHNIFHETYKQLPANKLIIRLQPDEGVEIQIMNKIPGLGENMQLQQSKLDLSFDETFKSQRIADAYERLLLEAMLGNQYLFVRRDEVEQAWKWIDGILGAWKANNEPPKSYQAGTWGPVAAISLLARDDRNWDE